MRRALAALLLAACGPAAWAAGGAFPLQQAETDLSNLASLQRGARNFVNYCLGCHSLKYMRYSQIGDDLALTEDQLRDNLMFTGSRVYDTMVSAMPAERARAWFGNAPPDLSLIARSRGVDYVYTFLKAFYVDPSRPTGVNNAVLAQTAMPHVLSGLQGLHAAKTGTTQEADGTEKHQVTGFERLTPGELTAAEYDAFVRDTVAFLEYVSEPAKAERQSLGVWVILFLLMFLAFARLLYKEYWKDVK